MKPTAILLSGIPTSGKSSFADHFRNRYGSEDFRTYRILCRDTIREVVYGTYKNIPFNKESEKEITKRFNTLCNLYIANKFSIIIDQTNCKEQYLKELIVDLEKHNYIIKVKFFDLTLWKAFFRNLKRRWITGKNIPWKVMKDMKRNYDKINKKDYERYK